MTEENASNRRYTVVVWGDSIAAGNADHQWPALAQRTINLVSRGGRPTKIFNESMGGKPASAARDEFDRRVRVHEPDLVIIQFGFNDQRYDGSRKNLPLSTVAEFEDHLLAMIQACQTVGAQVVVFGNHRSRTAIRLPSGQLYDEASAAYSQAAGRAAKTCGVRFYDLARELAMPEASWTDFICPDGVHLSTLGYYAYAHMAANVINDCIRMAE